jgi:hypothetical protein
MMPWGHLAVGYLAYTVLVRVQGRRAPEGAPTLVLALATQLPDLVDKPLNWWFSIFDGRGISHSLLAVTVVCALVFVLARKYDRDELSVAFLVGMYTHLLGDAGSALLSGQFDRATFLLWPLLPAPTYPKDSLIDHLDAWLFYLRMLPQSPMEFLTSRFGFQILLLFGLFGIWALDGFPGVGTLWRLVTRRPEDGATRVPGR